MTSSIGMTKSNLDLEQPVLVFRNDYENHSCFRFTTTRHGGVSRGEYASFNLSTHCGDCQENVLRNRHILCEKLDVDDSLLFVPRQVHGDGIVVIDDSFLSAYDPENGRCLPDCDALVSPLDDVCLGVTTADCVPVVFYCSDPSVVAVSHAGWRGTGKKIVNKVIASMTSIYGCNPENIEVTLFSCISKEVYEVGEEVVQAIKDTGIDMTGVALPGKGSGSYYLDLILANRRQLLLSGIPENRIEIIGDCTYSRQDDLFSARRQGIASGRILSGIVKKKIDKTDN